MADGRTDGASLRRTTGTESEIGARQKVTLIAGRYFRRTAPLIACEPKWLLAGSPNTNVMFENLTWFPPVTQIVSGDL